MSEQLGHELEPAVSEAIDELLESYPEHPYKKIFAQPHLRRTLLANVMSQLPMESMESEPSQGRASKPLALSLSQEQQIVLKTLIRQEIAYLIQQKSECISRSTTEEVESCFAPSHWFG
ncbi:MAG TPA: hypothetical protein V6C85_28535 [Allocoleopsis sp.]